MHSLACRHPLPGTASTPCHGRGAGSFGTAVAVLLVRAGIRTTLLARTVEQVTELAASRRNERYLPGVELPRELKVRALGAREDQFSRPDLIFLAVP
jgi:glycerol-3-phosphate dehydrogenase (NAD(P)+)